MLKLRLARIIAAVTLLLCLSESIPNWSLPAASGQETPSPPPTSAKTDFDEQQFAQELERLAVICERIELPKQAALCRRWQARERDDRSVLYLPSTDPYWPLGDPANAIRRDDPAAAMRHWARHFRLARQRHADHLFARASTLADTDEAAAFRLLWHVLREAPDHEQARRTLGSLVRSANFVAQAKSGRTALQDLGWEPRSYTRVDSPHFTIYSRADRSATHKVARQVERYYALWTQVFYPYWAAPGTLSRRIKGKPSVWPKHRRLEIVLLKDRSEYLQTLGVAEDNIGISVGYYNPSVKKCFFYPAENSEETLYHELTHQMMMEATGLDTQPDAGQAGGVWMLEGIALYMESLQFRSEYWTLGGLDADRMQTARYRGVRDGYWPEWTTFCASSTEQWKSDVDIARLYTHSLGLTQVFLHQLGPEARLAYFRTLAGLYQHDNQSSNLIEYLTLDRNSDADSVKQRYQELLILDDEAVTMIIDDASSFPSHGVGSQDIGNQNIGDQDADNQSIGIPDTNLHDLVLCGSQLEHATWKRLAELSQLHWLDVSFSNITDADLTWLAQAESIKRLSLEGTQTSKATLKEAIKLKSLNELDLSYCPNMNDEALAALRGHPALETLWLTETPVTESSLRILETLPKLRAVDVAGTRIQESEWNRFLENHPRLQ